MRSRWTFWILIALSLLATAKLRPFVRSIARAGENSSTPAPEAALSGLVEQVVREQLKEEYVDDDKWGQTRRVTVGYKVKGKPFDWDLKRREKEVNDGLWEKYQVRLIDPDENFRIRITRLEMNDKGRVEFEVWLTAKLAGNGRVERWRQGVKMLNAMAEAEAIVNVQLAGDVGIRMVPGDHLPAMAIEPAISKLNLDLAAFDLKRLSKIEGRAAHELGDTLKDTIQKELHRREPKIVAKLNKSIEKRKDKLRLSPEQFVKSGWSKLQATLGLDSAEKK